ncbi:hypothetical protein EDC96DRAFT_493210 [Choanephora cucurbitarum]|nr:hypothetical protein EDC96DRAFT_493210 [Choanephora cucurbitarum]
MIIDIYPKNTIKITTKTEYEREMKRITELFSQKESEETWEQFKRALNNLSLWIVEDKVSTFPTFEHHIKELKLPIIRCLESPRTLLSASASGLLKTMAQNMETKFAAKLNPLFIQAVIKQFGSTNKVHTARVLTDYKQVIEYAKLPKCIPQFSDYLTDKTKHKNNSNLRCCLAECLLVLIQVNPEVVLKRFSNEIEKAIRIASTDASASVRSVIRDLYKTYREKMPELFAIFHLTLTTTERKHLEAKSTPVAISRSASSSSSLHRSTTNSSAVLPRKSSSAQLGHKRTIDPKKGTPTRHSLPTLTRSSITTQLPAEPSQAVVTKTTHKKNDTTTSTQTNTPLVDLSTHSENNHLNQPMTHTPIDTQELNSPNTIKDSQETTLTAFSSMTASTEHTIIHTTEPESLPIEANDLILSSSSSSSSFSLPSPSSSSISVTENKRQHEDDTHTIRSAKKQKTLPPISTTKRTKSSLPPRTLSKPTEESQTLPPPPPLPPSSSLSSSGEHHELIGGSNVLQRFSNRRFVAKPFFPKKEAAPKLQFKKKGFGPNFRYKKRM